MDSEGKFNAAIARNILFKDATMSIQTYKLD